MLHKTSVWSSHEAYNISVYIIRIWQFTCKHKSLTAVFSNHSNSWCFQTKSTPLKKSAVEYMITWGLCWLLFQSWKERLVLWMLLCSLQLRKILPLKPVTRCLFIRILIFRSDLEISFLEKFQNLCPEIQIFQRGEAGLKFIQKFFVSLDKMK